MPSRASCVCRVGPDVRVFDFSSGFPCSACYGCASRRLHRNAQDQLRRLDNGFVSAPTTAEWMSWNAHVQSISVFCTPAVGESYIASKSRTDQMATDQLIVYCVATCLTASRAFRNLVRHGDGRAGAWLPQVELEYIRKTSSNNPRPRLVRTLQVSVENAQCGYYRSIPSGPRILNFVRMRAASYGMINSEGISGSEILTSRP